jgi:hypothetical protein
MTTHLTRRGALIATACASLIAALPAAGAGAGVGERGSQFAPATVHALCAAAFNLGTVGAPPDHLAYTSYSGPYVQHPGGVRSLVDAYPGWTPAEPGTDLIVHLKTRKPGWTIFMRDDTANPDLDVFILRGSCKRGTMQLVAADTDLARLDAAPAGEYLLIVDARTTGEVDGHTTAEIGTGI